MKFDSIVFNPKEENFIEVLENYESPKSFFGFPMTEIGNFYGVEIIQSSVVPLDEIWIVNKNQLVKIIKISREKDESN